MKKQGGEPIGVTKDLSLIWSTFTSPFSAVNTPLFLLKRFSQNSFFEYKRSVRISWVIMMSTLKIPKAFFQAQELRRRAWAFDQRRQFSAARADYMRATRIFASLVKKFPQLPVSHMCLEEGKLCLSQARQIRLGQSARKRAAPASGSQVSNHQRQQQELEDIIRQCRVIPDPHLSWSDIFGLDQVVQVIKDAVILPLQHPDLLQGRLKAPRALLLFGSSGCGKTSLLRVLASVVYQYGVSVFSVSAALLISKWQGESQKMIRALFNVAWKEAPSVIFIDEFDGVFGTPSPQSGRAQKSLVSPVSITAIQMQQELLQYMDGLQTPTVNRTVLIASTNFPWHLQPAQLRRFDRRLYVHPPSNSPVIRQFLEYLLVGVDHTLTSNDFHTLALLFKGYTPDEIKKVCEAARVRSYDSSTQSPLPIRRADIVACRHMVEPSLKAQRDEGMGTLRYRAWNLKHGFPQIQYPLEPWEKVDYDPSDDLELRAAGLVAEINYLDSLRADDAFPPQGGRF